MTTLETGAAVRGSLSKVTSASWGGGKEAPLWFLFHFATWITRRDSVSAPRATFPLFTFDTVLRATWRIKAFSPLTTNTLELCRIPPHVFRSKYHRKTHVIHQQVSNSGCCDTSSSPADLPEVNRALTTEKDYGNETDAGGDRERGGCDADLCASEIHWSGCRTLKRLQTGYSHVPWPTV